MSERDGSDSSSLAVTEPRRMRDVSSVRLALENALERHSQSPGEFFLAQFLGFAVTYPGDTCVVEFEPREFLENPRGTLHGGVMATALDTAMGHLVQRLGGSGTTVDLTVQYHRAPRPGTKIRCTGSVVHRARRIWFMKAVAQDVGGEIVASAVATMALQPRQQSGNVGECQGLD